MGKMTSVIDQMTGARATDRPPGRQGTEESGFSFVWRWLAGVIVMSTAVFPLSGQEQGTYDFYRDSPEMRAWVDAQLDYFYGTLVPALNARCDVAGKPRPIISKGVFYAAHDSHLYEGMDGWTTADGTEGVELSSGLRYRDANGSGTWSAGEYAWFDANGDGDFTTGETIFAGTGPGTDGEFGKPFPARLFYCDANANGGWDPGEDMWHEDPDADTGDLQRFQTSLQSVIGEYLNHKDEPFWNGSETPPEAWTVTSISLCTEVGTILSPPGSLYQYFTEQEGPFSWLRQQCAILNLLLYRLAGGWSYQNHHKSAFAYRGPYYQIDTVVLWDDGVYFNENAGDNTLTLGTPLEEVAPFNLTYSWSCCTLGPDPPTRWITGWNDCCGEGESWYALWGAGVPGIQWLYATAPGECTEKPWYLGAYSWEYFLAGNWYVALVVDVSPTDPERIAFSHAHSLAAGGMAVVGEALAPENAVGDLFDTEWANAQWQPASGSPLHVRAERFESNSWGYWPDGHDTGRREMVQEAIASIDMPAGCALEVYAMVTGRDGTTDAFPWCDTGKYYYWRRKHTMTGPGSVDFVFAPPPMPSVPDSAVPDGDYDASSWQTFTVYGVLKYGGDSVPDGTFLPLPQPPPWCPTGNIGGNLGVDTNRDDLVDVGVDLASFGPDTGTIAVQPEWSHPYVMIPLAVAQREELPIHAYLCQGAFDYEPNTEWTHPDASTQWFAFSLHSKAYISRLRVGYDGRLKIATVVRPRGNKVDFGFAWDDAESKFSPLGYAMSPNIRRTYVLRDTTPDNSLDANFELHFDSGIIHVYAGGEKADGALVEVRHVDGRSVLLSTLHECSFNLNDNTFSSPRYDGLLHWDNGDLTGLDFVTKDGLEVLPVNLERRNGTVHRWVNGLSKSISDFDVSTSAFGFGSGEVVLTFGNGTIVTKCGTNIMTYTPGCGTVTQYSTLSADGLPTYISTCANEDSNTLEYTYGAGSERYPDNGVPQWGKVTKIEYPDGTWERFEFDSDTGWLTKHIVPFKDASATDDDSQCQVTYYNYDNAISEGDPADTKLYSAMPTCAVVKTLGIETAREFAAYGNGADGRRYVRIRRCADQGADWYDSDNLEYLITYNGLGPADRATPVGYSAYSALLSNGQLSVTETNHRGQTIATVSNAFGVVISRTVSESGHICSHTVSATDSIGRITRTDYLDGTFELFGDLQWHGGALVHILRDGSQVTFTYHHAGEIRTQDHYGVLTELWYDDLGIVRQRRRRAGTLTAETKSRYDSRGRLGWSEDELGNATAVSYDGLNRKTTNPDGTKVFEEYFRDASPKSQSGNAAFEQQHDYGVTSNGETWACTKRKTAFGFIDLSYTYSDFLGRAHTLWQTDGSGPPSLMQTLSYDGAGRLATRTDSDGIGIVTEYNNCNEVSRTAVDLDGDGQISAGDRVTEYTRAVVSAAPPDGSPAVVCVRQTSTDTADNTSAVTYSSVDGFHRWSVCNGRTTHTKTELGAEPGERTVTTTYPDGTYEVQNYGEGLLTSAVSYDANDSLTATASYQYDAIRRQTEAQDGRTGVTVGVELDAADQVVRVERSDSSKDVTYDYDAMGRVDKIKRRGGGKIYYDYESTGQVSRVSGDGMMPRRYQYDTRGLRTAMKTFQGGLDGAGPVLTEWVYDNHSGRLTDKKINGLTVEEYDYTDAGRLDTVTKHLQAGTVTTSYSRNAAGEVDAVSHSDGSAGVSTVRDGKGRPSQITESVGTHTYAYNSDDQILTESLPQIPGGALHRTYDAVGRPQSTDLRLNGTTLVTWTNTYDNAGRLATTGDGHCAAAYSYLQASRMVETITCTTTGVDDRAIIARAYDTEDRLTGIVVQKPGTNPETVASWQYSEFTADGNRTRVDAQLADPNDVGTTHGLYWLYAYDDYGQLAAASCRTSGGDEVVPGREFLYDHDSINNRVTAGRMDPDTAAGEEIYTVNDLNQYTLRVLPGAVHVSGYAEADAVVTVNDQPTARDGAAFHVELPVDNSTGPANLAVTIKAVRYDAQEDQDVIVTASGEATIPAANEALPVGDRGVLAADSLLTYEWDVNDRMAAVQTATGIPGTASKRLEFAYDYQGRRVSKATYAWNAGTTSWDVEEDLRFVHDGWNLVAEIDMTSGSPVLVRSYVWGLDMAGLRNGIPGQDAGGIGGLVSISDWGTGGTVRTASRYAVADGNGNICALIDADSSDGVLETTEYAPFGRVVARHQHGVGAVPAGATSLCPFGFSSKYLDEDTSLLYFGYRYYSPDLGRWLCRDPLGEKGGANLYAYCHNDPINAVDPLGLAGYFIDGTGNYRDAQSNISRLAENYLEQPYYFGGPGNDEEYHGPIDNGLGKVVGLKSSEIAEAVYKKIAESWEAGDHDIDLFGFSRGAAIANEVAWLVHSRGIVDAKGRKLAERGSAKVRFLGLFDTVHSMGGPDGSTMGGYHTEHIAPCVQTMAHALARDETRNYFRPSLLQSLNPIFGGQTLFAVIFPGVHSDIGGHRVNNQHNDIADLTISWMAQKARSTGVPLSASLVLSPEEWNTILSDPDRTRPGPMGAPSKQFVNPLALPVLPVLLGRQRIFLHQRRTFSSTISHASPIE